VHSEGSIPFEPDFEQNYQHPPSQARTHFVRAICPAAFSELSPQRALKDCGGASNIRRWTELSQSANLLRVILDSTHTFPQTAIGPSMRSVRLAYMKNE
jgi:hypothetical protein